MCVRLCVCVCSNVCVLLLLVLLSFVNVCVVCASWSVVCVVRLYVRLVGCHPMLSACLFECPIVCVLVVGMCVNLCGVCVFVCVCGVFGRLCVLACLCVCVRKWV